MRIDQVGATENPNNLQHITSITQQQCGLPPTIQHRLSLFDLTPSPIHSDIMLCTGTEAPTTADIGDQLGPLSPTYGTTHLTSYDKVIFQNGQSFWIPIRAFARATGFPDSHHLYQDQSDSAAALASSSSPVTVALTLAIVLHHFGISITSPPFSPIAQIIMRAIPTQQVPEISILSKLGVLGTTSDLAQLLVEHAQPNAIEAALALVTQGITSTGSLSQAASTRDFISTIASHLQQGIQLTLSHINGSSVTPNHGAHTGGRLPDHFIPTFRRLTQKQQTHFLNYISPLLTPLHPLTHNITRAYAQIVHQYQSGISTGPFSTLHLAITISVIQDTAAKIILYIIPPFRPIEILHRTICIFLLKNTSPSCFSADDTSRTVTRSLLGRF